MKMDVRISLCQMKVTSDKNKNIEKAVGMITASAGNNTNIVILPEMFNCPYENSKFLEYAEKEGSSQTIEAISKAAVASGMYVIAGSIPEIDDEGKLYNTCFIFDNKGNVIGKHRKMHLFDIDIPGKITFKESDTLKAGNEITVVDTEFGTIGAAICYDIRFPELFRLMTLKGAQLIVLPGAFNMTTGPAHWELLLRTRAVDNQVFVAAVSPARDENASYKAFGNSMAVDPWADIMGKAGHGEEIIYADLDFAKMEKIRKELPLLKHRRSDIY